MPDLFYVTSLHFFLYPFECYDLGKALYNPSILLGRRKIERTILYLTVRNKKFDIIEKTEKPKKKNQKNRVADKQNNKQPTSCWLLHRLSLSN
jgi:hypothetical protein